MSLHATLSFIVLLQVGDKRVRLEKSFEFVLATIPAATWAVHHVDLDVRARRLAAAAKGRESPLAGRFATAGTLGVSRPGKGDMQTDIVHAHCCCGRSLRLQSMSAGHCGHSCRYSPESRQTEARAVVSAPGGLGVGVGGIGVGGGVGMNGGHLYNFRVDWPLPVEP